MEQVSVHWCFSDQSACIPGSMWQTSRRYVRGREKVNINGRGRIEKQLYSISQLQGRLKYGGSEKVLLFLSCNRIIGKHSNEANLTQGSFKIPGVPQQILDVRACGDNITFQTNQVLKLDSFEEMQLSKSVLTKFTCMFSMKDQLQNPSSLHAQALPLIGWQRCLILLWLLDCRRSSISVHFLCVGELDSKAKVVPRGFQTCLFCLFVVFSYLLSCSTSPEFSWPLKQNREM